MNSVATQHPSSHANVETAVEPRDDARSKILRVACVSYLNARPLSEGLDDLAGVEVIRDVPSALLGHVARGEADVALLPTIDYQRHEGLVIVPAGGIGCDGPTLTVRIFSRRPIGHIEQLRCDVDSHTSVALARIILAEQFGIRPAFIDGNSATRDAPLQDRDSLLLIGDKVICEEPAGYPHQLDLGEAWKSLTGLPFVFAVWTAREGVDLRDLPEQLERSKHLGLSRVDDLVERYGVPRGWPREIARKYLLDYLKFDIGPRQVEAIERFHALAHKHGALTTPPRPLRLYASAQI